MISHCNSELNKVLFIKFLNALMEFLKPLGHSSGISTITLLKGYHLDVVGGPSTPHDPESDAGGSLSSWQGHPSR
jgi:hypothetical protein